MKLAKLIFAVVMLHALLLNLPASAIAAGSGKNGSSQRGGKAAEHMSDKGAFNSNAQWSADPDKGWVRATWGTSENNRRAKFYQLTPAGRAQLGAETRDWWRYAAAVGKVLKATVKPAPAAAAKTNAQVTAPSPTTTGIAK